jgi:membrane protein
VTGIRGRLRRGARRVAGGAQAFVGRLWRSSVAAVQGFLAHLGPQLSAAIAYHVLLSIFPLLIFLVAILGLVLQDDEVQASVTEWLLDSLPLSEDAATDIARAVEGLATPASAAGVVAIAGLIWAASGVVAAARKSLDLVWEPPHRRPAGRAKIVDLLFILVAGALVLVSLGLTIVIEVVSERRDLGYFESVVSAWGELTRRLLPFLLTFGTFTVVYSRVPAARPPIRVTWTGALVAALAFEALKVGFAVYLANFASYNLIYGSLAAVVAFLIFSYLAGALFLLGAEFAVAWPESREPDPPTSGESEPLLQRVRRLVRGLFVRDPHPPRDDGR